ncbi:MAG: hypothetical protein JWL61_4032 [Gemmatimonadetes bacterium]|nr:hypothetical protein [Gemmatimonadota bacterium]
MSGRPTFRGYVIIWALLQLALPSAATYADAMLERAGVETVFAHVESNTGATCQPVHAADCDLCHLVQNRISPGGAPTCIPDFVEQRALPPDSYIDASAAAARAWLALPRAPPLV